jgi:hypothetical protein
MTDYSDVLTDHEKSIGCVASDLSPEYIVEFYRKLVENQQDLPPEFSETVDKHFWSLF